MSDPLYSFHFFPLKLPNKRNKFSIPSIKIPKQEKNILKLFFSFISIPFYFLLPNEV